MHLIPLRSVQTAKQQVPGLFWTANRQRQVLLNGEFLEHTGALEFAADPESGDAVLTGPQQGAALEHHIPFGGRGLAGDHIQKRGLASTIGTDHSPQLAGLQAEVEVTQRQESVEADGDLTQLE